MKNKTTSNTNTTVNLTSELRLEQALIEAGVKKPATITHLTITGELTSSDIFYIARIGENKSGIALPEFPLPEGINSEIKYLQMMMLSKKNWSDLKESVKYEFNKSHAICSTYIAYQMAYLMVHYTTEFIDESVVWQEERGK